MVQETNQFIQASVWHCLNHYSYEDAIFIAERLFSEADSDENLFLLASAYYKFGKIGLSYSLLQKHGCRTSHGKYLMAKCCVDLNKFNEAEAILNGGSILKSRTIEDIVNEFGDTASFAIQLLAKIYSNTERKTKACEYYKKSLKLNPFLWTSFESLCDLGEKIEPSKVFQIPSNDNPTMCYGMNPVMSFITSNDGNLSPQMTENNTPKSFSGNCQVSPLISNLKNVPDVDQNCVDTNINAYCPPIMVSSSRGKYKEVRFKSMFSNPSSLSPVTPGLGVVLLDTSSNLDNSNSSDLDFLTPPTQCTTLQDYRKTNRKEALGVSHLSKPAVFSQSGNTSNALNVMQHSQPVSNLTILPGQNVRRSSRLFTTNNSVKENNKGPTKKFVTPKGPCKKTRSTKMSNLNSQHSYSEMNEKNRLDSRGICNKIEPVESKQVLSQCQPHTHLQNYSSQYIQVLTHQAQKHSLEWLMSLLRDMGAAYKELALYDCLRAIETLSSLPSKHYNSSWVQIHLGKAHFELADYQEAIGCFSKVHNREPYRMNGMEYYSTALWHLQKEVTLSALAQSLVEYDKMAPQTWCATGNCFSLQKEHEAAIKFFHRAVQVDPQFTYAYTLLGHEYVSTEELEKALRCFRNAVRINPRHYNAWYGIGMIYYKQERYQVAEIYFQKALSINSMSSILMCHVGVVQHALQKTSEALTTLNKAIQLDKKNPLCKFHRASIYFHSDKYQEALKELEELREMIPKESLVYFLMGKVHKKLGNTHLALMNFSWAMDLDPKGANNHIKEGIDPAMNRFANDDDEIAFSFKGNGPGEELSDSSLLPSQISSQESFAECAHLQTMESDESL